MNGCRCLVLGYVTLMGVVACCSSTASLAEKDRSTNRRPSQARP